MAGQLMWSPSEFWQSTFAELYYMHRGWLISQGIDPDVNSNPATRNDLEKLMEQFPDG